MGLTIPYKRSARTSRSNTREVHGPQVSSTRGMHGPHDPARECEAVRRVERGRIACNHVKDSEGGSAIKQPLPHSSCTLLPQAPRLQPSTQNRCGPQTHLPSVQLASAVLLTRLTHGEKKDKSVLRIICLTSYASALNCFAADFKYRPCLQSFLSGPSDV